MKGIFAGAFLSLVSLNFIFIFRLLQQQLLRSKVLITEIAGCHRLIVTSFIFLLVLYLFGGGKIVLRSFIRKTSF